MENWNRGYIIIKEEEDNDKEKTKQSSLSKVVTPMSIAKTPDTRKVN
jgi:hypothetical protein